MVRTGMIPIADGALFYREVGRGPPILILHGGPGILDHTYLLPDMDRLADDHRLIYYDQRCGGGSTGDAQSAAEVDVESFVRDVEAVCEACELERVALLGHSWGGHLAMRHAIAHPDRVSHLILMNTSPASKRDFDAFRHFQANLLMAVRERIAGLRATPASATGDPSAVAELMRLYFSVGIVRPDDLARLELTFTRENVVRGRVLAARFDRVLFDQEFDLKPQLASLRVPTLMLHGDRDFIPFDAVAPIAEAIPDTHVVVLPECGHFAYLEAPDAVHREVTRFLRPRS